MVKRELKTMTVRELKTLLEGYDDDMKVCYQHPSHDYWETQLAGRIRHAEEADVEYTEYHLCHQVLEESDDDKDDENFVAKEQDSVERVLLLM